MKLRIGLILSVFLLVVTPIVVTGFVTINATEKVLQNNISAIQINTVEINRVRENIIYLFIIGTVLSLTGAGIFATSLADSVNKIKKGLDGIGKDLEVRIPALGGVLGEIGASINEMADNLRETRLHRDALEAQVLRSNRLAGLGQLAAGVAHEIRNPLTAVKGFSQVLEEELPEDDEKREYTSVIIKEVNRLEKIVQGLLAFARPASSYFRPENIVDIMEETLLLAEKGAFKHRIQIARNYDPQVIAEVDREQLQQVFLNLLLNAAQAISERGNISVIIKRVEDEVQVSVKDSGCGIPAENLVKLFDPFFTTREQGTGLGLAMVHRLVEIHSGRIEVNSDLAQGTEFLISLPLRQRGEDCDSGKLQNTSS